MARTKWYQGLLILVVILYISSVWTTGAIESSSGNSSGSLVSLTSLLELPNYGFICWFLWKIQERKLNVEGLVAFLLFSLSQFIHSLYLIYGGLGKPFVPVLLIGFCLIGPFLLLRKIELNSLLSSWKSRRSWQKSTVLLGLGLATYELSGYSLFFTFPYEDIFFYYVMFALNTGIVFLFLILMTKEDLKSLQCYSTILLALCLLNVIGYIIPSHYLSFSAIFYLLLSIYQVCRINGIFDKYAQKWVTENQWDMSDECTESEIIKSNHITEKEREENHEQSEYQAAADSCQKAVALNSPWLWTALAMAVLCLSLLFSGLLGAGNFAILYLAFTFIFNGLYILATILLWIGMRSGRTAFLMVSMILFLLSSLLSRNPVSILLVILIWIGSRDSREKAS